MQRLYPGLQVIECRTLCGWEFIVERSGASPFVYQSIHP